MALLLILEADLFRVKVVLPDLLLNELVPLFPGEKALEGLVHPFAGQGRLLGDGRIDARLDRKSTRLNSSHYS